MQLCTLLKKMPEFYSKIEKYWQLVGRQRMQATVILQRLFFNRSLYLYRKKGYNRFRHLKLQNTYCKRLRSNTCQITDFFLNTVHFTVVIYDLQCTYC